MNVGLTVGDSLERLDRLGSDADFVELAVGEGGLEPAAVDTDRLDSMLADADVDLCVHLPFQQVVATAVPEIDEAIVAYQRRLLAWAGAVGAEKAVLHATVRRQHDTELREPFARGLERIVAAGVDAGVEVVLENVGHQRRGLQLSVLGDLAREAGAPVCFDVGHAYMEDGDDGIDRFLTSDGDLVTHLHVHDVRSRGDTHLPIGAGEVDYDLVADHLAGFDGTVAVEVFTDDRPLLRDSMRRIRRHLEPTA